MSEYTTLTSYLEAVVAEREALDNVDVEAKVEERIAEIRAQVRHSIVAEIEHSKLIADVKINTINDAIAIVTRPEVVEVEDDVTEVISDETY